jgi:cupin 2 domain-containing protein
MKVRNIFSDIPVALSEEQFDPLLEGKELRLERILSRGHATPEGEWYDQERDEWVLLLRGSAGLRVAEGVIELRPGDYLLLPAHARHRVEWTDRETETVWLALHFTAAEISS